MCIQSVWAEIELLVIFARLDFAQLEFFQEQAKEFDIVSVRGRPRRS